MNPCLRILCSLFVLGGLAATAFSRPADGPVRVLFLGQESDKHKGKFYYPILAKALGREAIYFDYVPSPKAAFSDPGYLNLFDAVLLYADHEELDPSHWKNLRDFIEGGGGFVPVHSASGCFQNIPEFGKVLGARLDHHDEAIFRPKTLEPDHPAIKGVAELEAWDETILHKNHIPEGRTVLQVREAADDDTKTEAEPWTWVRQQGEGRVFYTASGHDERVWSQPAFHNLLKQGILWSVGEERLASYEQFISERVPLTYQDNNQIPNYEKRPRPLPMQDPLPPAESLNYTQIRADFELKLFAAEPDIINPICMAWDERGRLWVAETVDYPNEIKEGRGDDCIKILEDTDNDGQADKVTVFADGLNIPTSLTFWNGGVIVAQAPHSLYLKDEDGDDRADINTVLFTGWGTRDTHAGPSNLRYGIDNWIYGAVGYSAFKGKVGGEAHQFGSGIYRFKPDGSKMEFLHQFNNNTWGLGFNSAGEVFGSTANRNPAFFGGFPQTGHTGGQKAMSAKMIANHANFYPITPNIRQVDAVGLYTAGAGYTLATSDNFPTSFRDKMAFIGGPTGNLLGMFDNSRYESGYRASNRFNFIASADEWFSPVAAEIGPDGNLWIADWYNFIIQHNPAPTVERGGYDAVNGIGNAYESPNRDKQHGRIYRSVWKEAKPSSITSLANATDDELLEALSHHNQFWRLTAQRLIVEGRETSLAPRLKDLVAVGGVAGAHALWTLDGLGQLDHETHQLALLKPDPVLKRNAIRAIPNTDEGMQLFFDTAVVTARDSLVRLAAFAKLAHFPDRERVELAARQLAKVPDNANDEWLQLALRSAGAPPMKRGIAKPIGPNLLPNPSFEQLDGDGDPIDWTIRHYDGEGEHALTNEVARTGQHSLRISSLNGVDTSYHARLRVQPNTDYRLSGWIKIERALEGNGSGAQLNVHELQKKGATEPLVTTNGEWQRVETTFNSGNSQRLTVNLRLGGWGQSAGTAWWDDVAVHQLKYEMIEVSEESAPEGDAGRGREIFMTHQIAGCIRCHKVEGKGEGVIGPALDGIASRKTEDYLMESLVDPGAQIAEGFQAEVSPMPPMGVLLKPQELADVMAYLLTLRE